MKATRHNEAERCIAFAFFFGWMHLIPKSGMFLMALETGHEILVRDSFTKITEKRQRWMDGWTLAIAIFVPNREELLEKKWTKRRPHRHRQDFHSFWGKIHWNIHSDSIVILRAQFAFLHSFLHSLLFYTRHWMRS